MYNLNIQSPFALQIDDKIYNFQCLIKGYGSKQGMIIDKDWNKISPIKDQITTMGYGYSCFDIEAIDLNNFKEVLNDWGATNA